MEEIKRMQNNLLLIRRTVGWTAEEFGNQIGVTRQTINNIESGRNKLTKTQYIAMRSVLDAEMIRHPEGTEMLAILLDVLVDHPEKYSDKETNKLLEQANFLTPSILAGTATREAVSKEWMKSAGLIGAVATLAAGMTIGAAGVVASPVVGGAIGAGAISTWLAKAIKSVEKKK